MNTCTLNISDYHFFYIQAWFWVRWSVRWFRWRLWPSEDPPCCPTAVLAAFPHEAAAAFLLPWREGRTVEGTCSGDCGPVWLHFPPETVHAGWTSVQCCLHSVGQTTDPPVCTDPGTYDGDFDSVDKSVRLFLRFLPLGLPSHVLRQPPGLHLPLPHGHADQERDLPDASVQSHASAPHPGQAGERAVLWALLPLALQPKVGAGGCRGGGSVWGGGQQPPLQLPSPHRKVGDCGDSGDHEGSDCGDGRDVMTIMVTMVMVWRWWSWG